MEADVREVQRKWLQETFEPYFEEDNNDEPESKEPESKEPDCQALTGDKTGKCQQTPGCCVSNPVQKRKYYKWLEKTRPFVKDKTTKQWKRRDLPLPKKRRNICLPLNWPAKWDPALLQADKEKIAARGGTKERLCP